MVRPYCKHPDGYWRVIEELIDISSSMVQVVVSRKGGVIDSKTTKTQKQRTDIRPRRLWGGLWDFAAFSFRSWVYNNNYYYIANACEDKVLALSVWRPHWFPTYDWNSAIQFMDPERVGSCRWNGTATLHGSWDFKTSGLTAAVILNFWHPNAGHNILLMWL